jgi:acyl carrier protein
LTISPEQIEKLLDLVAKEGMIDRGSLKLDSTLESLGIKSVDLVMILMAIEEQFAAYIPIDGPLSEAKTVKDFLEAIAPHLKTGGA